jgi:FKBP-type peptidyl-prolyl cis-trans isomerase SlyD
MKIANDHVVHLHYTLTDSAGRQLESSQGGAPMSYLHGHNNIIVGLEEALTGKAAGDRLTVTVPPEKGYGMRRPDMVQRVPVKHLQGAKTWRPGMVAVVQTEQGARQVQVVKVGRFMADVDFNHPMVGETLTFDVEVVSIRPADAEEIAHGHVHEHGRHE